MKSIRLTLTGEERRLLETARAAGFTSLAGAARGAALSLLRAVPPVPAATPSHEFRSSPAPASRPSQPASHS